MSVPFLGEIRRFAFDFAPHGWAACNGQSMPVSQNQALHELLGKTYGGEGNTFKLPDLRGVTAVGQDAPGGQPIGKAVVGARTGPQDYLTITFGIALQGDFPSRG